MTDLLDAVQALTTPVKDHIVRKNDEGKWLEAHTVTNPPLLQQYANAVQPSSNRTAGSASTAATRAPIDLEAAFEFARMSAQIGDWCRMVKIQSTRDPVKDLDRWYAARLSIRDLDDTFYIRTLNGWAWRIRNHLAPPRSFILEAPCPVCGGTAWGDMINGGGSWPIEVKYHLDDNQSMTDEAALCRLCRVVWEGHDSVVELADELNERTA